jgi:hypothetical protein
MGILALVLSSPNITLKTSAKSFQPTMIPRRLAGSDVSKPQPCLEEIQDQFFY